MSNPAPLPRERGCADSIDFVLGSLTSSTFPDSRSKLLLPKPIRVRYHLMDLVTTKLITTTPKINTSKYSSSNSVKSNWMRADKRTDAQAVFTNRLRSRSSVQSVLHVARPANHTSFAQQGYGCGCGYLLLWVMCGTALHNTNTRQKEP